MPQPPRSWTFIDELERDSLILQESDICYYYLVRTSGGYTASEANNRIENFKKNPESYRNRPDVWDYKLEQIREFAEDVSTFINNNDFRHMLNRFPNAVIAPLPTSKPKAHEHFDSRLEDMCEIIATNTKGLVCECPFDMRRAVQPAHLGGSRDVEFLKSVITFNGFSSFTPDLVILIDDVLTTGSHYVVCRDFIRERYPGAAIIGLFLSIHRNDQFEYATVGINP